MWSPLSVGDRLVRLQRAIGARFVDDFGQVLRQQFQRGIDRQPEVPGEFLNLSIAENRFKLFFGDRKIGARPEPGLNLCVEPALLQRGDQPVEIVILRLGLMATGSAAASTSPSAPLNAAPRLRLSSRPMSPPCKRFSGPPAWK
jgi:hypothetical protein